MVARFLCGFFCKHILMYFCIKNCNKEKSKHSNKKSSDRLMLANKFNIGMIQRRTAGNATIINSKDDGS